MIGKSKRVHAEIEYFSKKRNMAIHSDICPVDHLASNITDPEYVTFLHTCLDEWITNSNGTGKFIISNEDSSV